MKLTNDNVLKLFNALTAFKICIVIACFFYEPKAAGIAAGLWGLSFIASELHMRNYFKGKPMMKFGTLTEEDPGDVDSIRNTYYLNIFIVLLVFIFMVLTLIRAIS